MLVRINHASAVDNVDMGVEFIRESVIPEIEGHNGFQGLVVLGAQSQGIHLLGLWAGADELAESDILRRSRPEDVVVSVRRVSHTALGSTVVASTTSVLASSGDLAEGDLTGQAAQVTVGEVGGADIEELFTRLGMDSSPEMLRALLLNDEDGSYVHVEIGAEAGDLTVLAHHLPSNR